jgi:MFS family permease
MSRPRGIRRILSALALAPTFAAFREPWYRWFWAGRTLSSGAYQIRSVVRGWLIYSLTGSALALTAVEASADVATLLFSVPAGVVCDRLDRRNVMLVGTGAVGVVFIGVAALIFTGAITVWHLAISGLLMGFLFSLVIPARMALTGDLMPRETLLNAMALVWVGLGLVGTFSSGLGGVLVDRAGPGVVYLIMAAAYLITAGLYFGVPAGQRRERRLGSVLTDLIEGGRYLLTNPSLVALTLLELVRTILYNPYMTLLPVLASDVYQSGAVGLGLLRGASSLGGLLGSLIVASLGDVRRKGLLLLGSGALAGASLILLGQSPSLALGMGAIVLVTTMSNAYMVTEGTLVQSAAEPRMRGRVQGFARLMFGLAPVGSLPAGALADAMGARFTVTVLGVCVMVVFVLMGLLQPRLREL